MAGQVSLAIVIVLINFGFSEGSNHLWCYECNTNIRTSHTRSCNDPYVPTPYFDLAFCPQNESHHCLKSVIDYGDVLVTVRGCVPTRQIDGYCQPEKDFLGATIMCSFCHNYACNGQTYIYLLFPGNFTLFLLLVIIVTYL